MAGDTEQFELAMALETQAIAEVQTSKKSKKDSVEERDDYLKYDPLGNFNPFNQTQTNEQVEWQMEILCNSFD